MKTPWYYDVMNALLTDVPSNFIYHGFGISLILGDQENLLSTYPGKTLFTMVLPLGKIMNVHFLGFSIDGRPKLNGYWS